MSRRYATPETFERSHSDKKTSWLWHGATVVLAVLGIGCDPVPPTDPPGSTTTTTTPETTTTIPETTTTTEMPTTTATTVPRSTIAFVGDSVTRLTAPYYEAALSSQYNLNMRYQNGRRIDEMLPALEELLAEDPDAVVFNLGTNDAVQNSLNVDWHPHLVYAANLLDSADICVEFMSINTYVSDLYVRGPSDPNWGNYANQAGHDPYTAYTINTELNEIVASNSDFHLINWDGEVKAPGGNANLMFDMIHPEAVGSQRLASLVQQEIAEDCNL